MGIAQAGVVQPHFSYAEQAEFRLTFERVKSSLPQLFASFWHRWSYIPGETPALLVYGEDGNVTLCMVRESPGPYRAIGIALGGSHQPFSAIGPTISAVIKSLGLL